ncbi:CAAX geranylgeranyltransferase alpha subunit [Coemansia sp. RSA 1813]|nr:CAAX geranylgeranyltransferase alpha subunit [Coemansia sp. RSA 1646]KAJ1772259.1 CAAX geranylgeranyltransferase alpha subunit [Coemansia sp. RSA 1843]KAJ2091891.1 CAAX geranylgeranyltransferase alpha subunit [Coemansia sp. RSA 986]KAJ2215783.1 CAAX geranylgeranyltransferase alpha subunit [Coemansia sp. RSA 487]KAJ2571714.1 CAAX geranylgeranyltransferase alpha subunit [Coemansia sp. RSA 1813]
MGESNKNDDDKGCRVPLKEQEEWKDVTPIPQEEEINTVCPIAYTDEYSDMMSYLRAVMAKCEVSQRALDLTGRIIKVNPGHYTVWMYRKKLVEDLDTDSESELSWVTEISEIHHKNYQLWHYREALISRLLDPRTVEDLTQDQLVNNPVIRRELLFASNAIDGDSKNFHAWSYRQWIVRTYGIWDQELVFIETMINEDVRNNSAWNQRYFVLMGNGRGKPARELEPSSLEDALADREIDYAIEKIKLAPNNESPWSYITGLLLRHAPAKLYNTLLPKLQELAAAGGEYAISMTGTPMYWSTLVDIYEQQAQALPDQANALLANARDACDLLASDHDPMRNRYWDFRKSQLTVGNASN